MTREIINSRDAGIHPRADPGKNDPTDLTDQRGGLFEQRRVVGGVGMYYAAQVGRVGENVVPDSHVVFL